MSLGEPREHHETIGSTNERARELAEEGAAHGTLVTADEQTAGRGRQGRGWVTPPGVAIAASLILRDYDDLLPLRAGLAVADVAGPSALSSGPTTSGSTAGRSRASSSRRAATGRCWGSGSTSPLDPATLPPEVAAIAGTLGRDESEIERTLTELLARSRRAWTRRRPTTLAALRDRDALLGRRSAGTAARASARASTTTAGCSSASPTGRTTTLSAGEVTLTT